MNRFDALLAEAQPGKPVEVYAKALGMSDREFDDWAGTMIGVAQRGFVASHPHRDADTGLIDAIIVTKS